jgi:hypothetical protein
VFPSIGRERLEFTSIGGTMRKSLLVTILFATVVGCGDDGTGPEQTVAANLIIDFDAWDESEGAYRRSVDVVIMRGGDHDRRHFTDLPREGVVAITTDLPCTGDLLYDPIRVEADGYSVRGVTHLDGFACTEEPQVVELYPLTGDVCVNPDNWFGDC